MEFFYYFVLFEWYFCNYCIIRKIRGDNYRNLYRNLFEREVLRYPQAYQLAGLRFLYTVLKLSWGCPTPFYMLSHLPTSSAVNPNRHAVLLSQGLSNPFLFAIAYINLICNWTHLIIPCCFPRGYPTPFYMLSHLPTSSATELISSCSATLPQKVRRRCEASEKQSFSQDFLSHTLRRSPSVWHCP